MILNQYNRCILNNHWTIVFLWRIMLVLLLYGSTNNFISCRKLPFQLGIRDTFMIAHSFHNHPSFGPAGGMHGATYTCDVEFGSKELTKETSWVIDIGLASNIVATVLKKYNYQNLDEIFPTILTTTEFMCQQIYHDIKELMKVQCPEFVGELCVKLWESHKAWASYTGVI